MILATAPATINALGGDDLICTAGGSLDAGAGNDSVLATSAAPNVAQEAHLGTGANHYTSVLMSTSSSAARPPSPTSTSSTPASAATW